MAKVAFIGAGSTVFTRNLVGDIVGTPELADATTIALMDIDAERPGTSELVAAARRAPRRSRAGRGDRRAVCLPRQRVPNRRDGGRLIDNLPAGAAG
jgi:Family 4 glycosyl hydrolase